MGTCPVPYTLATPVDLGKTRVEKTGPRVVAQSVVGTLAPSSWGAQLRPAGREQWGWGL